MLMCISNVSLIVKNELASTKIHFWESKLNLIEILLMQIMVQITSDVKRMMNTQKMIFVGTTNEQGVPNVSPRSSFYVDTDVIYWYEIFRHKSYENFMTNNWVSVAVVDNVEFSGYQLKGHIKIITDKENYFYAATRISKNLPKNHEEYVQKLISEQDVKIIQFQPVVLYSLNPVAFEKAPGVLESDVDVDKMPEL